RINPRLRSSSQLANPGESKLRPAGSSSHSSALRPAFATSAASGSRPASSSPSTAAKREKPRSRARYSSVSSRMAACLDLPSQATVICIRPMVALSMAKQEDAKLILELYALRREAEMRKARTWFVREFHPSSLQAVLDVLAGERSAWLRMITSYWEMAATLVVHGAIDAQMFNESNGEHVLVFAKIEPFLAD